ncbi:MAG: histone deacetylase family protein [Spirochaetes bacterium]|nr:histone deacetylase family protein [Spirochaetota bacterium]
MKVIFHNDFYSVYSCEPAAEPGRMESIMKALGDKYEIIEAMDASSKDIEAAHSVTHISNMRQLAAYNCAVKAAGGSIQAAVIGLTEPAFAAVRPPGHHASRESAWGFCYFNNMAIALMHLMNNDKIKTAAVLDFDLHLGDGNLNILSGLGTVRICNPVEMNRKAYLNSVQEFLDSLNTDIIGVSAGFDYHEKDWGLLLKTEDYFTMGQMIKKTAERIGAGYFGILEGGYNYDVLGESVLAFLQGMDKT